MMIYKKSRQVGLLVAVIMGAALLDHSASGQDAAWEGLINAGRNALQQQRFSEAERHFEEALEAAEQFPSGDSRLGKSYNNLAAVYYAQEDYSRAEPLMRRALAQLRESLGPENTEVAQTMKNLAALYYLQGNRSEAEALLKQSLEVLEKVHGPNHAFVATVLSNLAGLYQAENRYQDAEPLLTRSLAIWESLLGPEHPDVVRSRTLLANVRRSQGDGFTPTEAVAAPRTLTEPLTASEDQADPSADGQKIDAAAEIAQATKALEDLTKEAVANAAFDDPASGVGGPGPVPLPKPDFDDVAEVDLDAAASPEGQVEAEQQGEPAAAGDDKAPGEIVISALTDDPQGSAAAIFDVATSASDVSFSVYLSTLWSVDEARRYWQAMQDALPDVLENKKMEIEEVAAAAGSEPFYRVLTFPFSSDPEAQAACDEIRAKLRTHDCNVVIREASKAKAAGD